MLRRCVLWISSVLFFFKQKTAYEMRISDWSSDVCSSDLVPDRLCRDLAEMRKRLVAILDFLHLLAEQRQVLLVRGRVGFDQLQIGRASCRERVCQYV